MSDNQQKYLPSGELRLVLTSGGGLPSFHVPDVKAPFRGREGQRIRNEIREKYFRMWHSMALARLAIISSVILNDYALEALDMEISRMLDRYLNTERPAAALAIMEEVTEVCIKNLVAQVRAILENHPRRLGEII